MAGLPPFIFFSTSQMALKRELLSGYRPFPEAACVEEKVGPS
jgi:hypothetical protein